LYCLVVVVVVAVAVVVVAVASAAAAATIRMHTFCVKNWRLIHLCCFNRGPCRVACMHWIGIGPNYPPVILMLLDH
jgi:hypothetical protein